MTRALFRLFAFIALGAGLSAPTVAHAADSVWDLELGASASQQPIGFIDFACGGNGGPPTTPLTGFSEFEKCAADEQGLHEVYFRYDDESDELRLAWQRWPLARVAGTRVYGIRAMLSALFDSAGTLVGVRILSDARGVPAGERNDHWRLAAVLQAHYHSVEWDCSDTPLRPRETIASSFFVKRSCSGTAAGVQFFLAQDYFHKAGQAFVDEFGKVQGTYFVSNSRFEFVQSPGQ
ncbi:hypothetical protein [Devosia sp. A449]